MIKKIFLLLILIFVPTFAQTLKLDDNSYKIIKEAGINISDLSSLKYGNIIKSDKKSLVLFAKINLQYDISKYQIFDLYLSDQKFTNNRKNLIAILIITDNHVDIFSEWVCKSCSSALNEFYHDPLELIIAKKVSKILPKKIPKTQEGIIIPTQAGIDTYLFWNGKKYELFTSDEIP